MKKIFIGLMLFSLLGVAASDARTWTSKSGNSIEAEFVSFGMDIVTLKRSGGDKVEIPLDRLSDEDQAYVKSGKADKPKVVQKVSKPKETAEPSLSGDTTHLKNIFGSALYKANREIRATDTMAGKKVGIYFSAHWCSPCRKFTPKLVEFYNKMKTQGKPFEIVFVSADRGREEMFGYMKEARMPWLAMEYDSVLAKKVKEKYGSGGIPRLVVLDASGRLASSNARYDVDRMGASAFGRW